MVRKAAGEYSKTKEEQLSQAAKVAFDWFSTRYGAFTNKLNWGKLERKKMNHYKDWIAETGRNSAVQKRNAAVLLRKDGRLASQYAL